MILTKELFKAGLKKGQMSRAQCILFGIPVTNNRRKKKSLIGMEITEEQYSQFVKLKSPQRTQKQKSTVKQFYENELCPNKPLGDLTFKKLLITARRYKGWFPKAITKMKYYDFLKTPYWRIVSSEKKKLSNNKCERCGSSEGLNVHHTTYLHHGEEITHLEDLVVLCRSCHQKEHERLKQLGINILIPIQKNVDGIK